MQPYWLTRATRELRAVSALAASVLRAPPAAAAAASQLSSDRGAGARAVCREQLCSPQNSCWGVMAFTRPPLHSPRYITPPGTGFLPRETALHHQVPRRALPRAQLSVFGCGGVLRVWVPAARRRSLLGVAVLRGRAASTLRPPARRGAAPAACRSGSCRWWTRPWMRPALHLTK